MPIQTRYLFSAAMDVEWWGAINGGTVLSTPAPGSRPAAERIEARSSAPAASSRGSSPTNR